MTVVNRFVVPYFSYTNLPYTVILSLTYNNEYHMPLSNKNKNKHIRETDVIRFFTQSVPKRMQLKN